MTHSYVWHDSFTCVTWLIHMCDMPYSYMCQDASTCVTGLMHMCNMTHSYGRQESFLHIHTHLGGPLRGGNGFIDVPQFLHCQNFSKVSSLLNLINSMMIQLTYENFCKRVHRRPTYPPLAKIPPKKSSLLHLLYKKKKALTFVYTINFKKNDQTTDLLNWLNTEFVAKNDKRADSSEFLEEGSWRPTRSSTGRISWKSALSSFYIVNSVASRLLRTFGNGLLTPHAVLYP
jgi:hypothetical protein